MASHAFFEGEFVPIENAAVNIRTHAFNYGTGVFGGLRGYWNDDEEQLYVFRIEDHYRRFLDSCKFLLLDIPFSVQELKDITVELLRREGYKQDCYCRPLAYKADEQIGVKLHDLRSEFALFAEPFGAYLKREEGTKVTVSSWRRIDDNAIPARGKIVGTYVNSALIKTDAVQAGYDDAIVLSQDGHVSEGSAMNLFMVRNGTLVTSPVTANILEGITRRTMMYLAREELGMDVEVREIDRTELYVADELFFCGTGVQVAAITEVDHRPIGDGTMGPVVSKVRKLYFDIVRGNVDKYRERWCTPIYQQ